MKAALSRPSAELDTATPVLPEVDAARGHSTGVDLLARLESLCAGRGLDALAHRLHELVAFVGYDLAAFEVEFTRLPRDPRLVGQSATQLLDLGGKRLRPMCLALAARLGSGFDQRALDLSVAAELVHSATLLHDDVVDLSDSRRGAPTARAVYGNAASIFAGDWLLVEALRRVHACNMPGLMAELFDTIEEMIWAESLQLECRGRLSIGREVYFQVVEGKTASLFRWAMRAGAAVGGVDDVSADALGEYGRHLGVAFQAVDDLLDLTGDASTTGKDLFADLREGKMTFPVIVALERDPALRPLIYKLTDDNEGAAFSPQDAQQVVEILRATRAVEDCLDLARRTSAAAVASLAPLPDGPSKRSLVTVAEALVDRDL